MLKANAIKGTLATLAAISICAGCSAVDENSETVPSPESSSLLEDEAVEFEQVSIGRERLNQNGTFQRDLSSMIQPEVCDCPDLECMKTWVREQLGCQLCVSIRCPNVDGFHFCSSDCD